MGVLESLVEVKLPSSLKAYALAAGQEDAISDDARAEFLKIKETLTRMGIPSKKENKLFQSCHILHKQGKYYIVHFKEMFLLDGRQSNFEEEDVLRRNLIAKRLEEWNLLKIVDPAKVDIGDKQVYVKVIPFKEKDNWELIAKYNVGKVKGTKDDTRANYS
jgi:hypothetical protein